MDTSKLVGLAKRLDQLSYYQVLGAKPGADMRDIRSAYHRRARTIHPDLFYEHSDPEFKDAVDKIFKRISEAYVVLRDEEKRGYYDRGLTGEKKRLRYTDEDDRSLRQEKIAKQGKTSQGRKCYEEAIRLYEDGKTKKALQNLRMAITFEKENHHFQTLLAKWLEKTE